MSDFIPTYTGAMRADATTAEEEKVACNDSFNYIFNELIPAFNTAVPIVMGYSGFIPVYYSGANIEDVDNTTEVQSAIDASITTNKPLLNELYKYRTGALANTDKVQMINLSPEHIKINIDTAKNVLFVGDSLTEMRGGDSYVRHIVDALSAHYGGYKEPSYIPLSGYRTEEFDGVITTSAGMTSMWGESDGQWNVAPYNYSPDGKGMYTTNGSGSDYVAVNWNSSYRFTSFKVIYRQKTGGGTFDIGCIYTSADNLININTDGAESLQVATYDCSSEVDCSIRIKNITGNVDVYGVIVENADQKGGFKYDVWARNGIKLYDFEGLVATADYENELQHDLAIINIGTNDSNVPIDVTTYGNMLVSYAGKLTQNNPGLKIILLEPVQPQFYYSTSTLYKEYADKRRELAIANGWGIIDTPSAIGGYGELAGKGMMEDEVHPNSYGKRLVSKAVADYLDVSLLDVAVKYDENSNYLTQTQEEEIYIVVSLTSTPQVVANLGMYDVSEMLFMEVEAMAAVGSNGAVCKGNFDMGTFSATPDGSVGYVRDYKETYNEPIGASSSYNLDLTVQLSATNDCEILAATTGSLASSTMIIKIKSISTKRKANKTFFMVK